ncbi:hypothetical protein CRU92_00900 [Arcobacter sp. FW59]|uniref:restriction endonuclease n=1 Tax=Arcobacter sp. CECT 9188 TaxID=2044505 RepID=UPI000DE838BD|nr:restriction endonuclease [Arcobacter sp. CECT 9188]RBQ27612.1 hypothetical protein CRU88_02800 [Arcobacter sp. CECT 9188]RBQ32302.1 hypothetical protein CRU92_00900 [Arcobacter sp. FW59]
MNEAYILVSMSAIFGGFISYKYFIPKYKQDIKDLQKDRNQKDNRITELEKELNNKNKNLDLFNTPNENQINRGREYELFIKELYEQKGYTVEDRAGLKDGGIDLIATKDGYKTVLIQCKYWTSKFKENLEKLKNKYHGKELAEKDLKGNYIEHNKIKEFLGSCTKYLISNNDLHNIDSYDFIFIIPYFHNLKYSAEMELKDINQKVKLKKVEMYNRFDKKVKNNYQLILGILEAENKCYEPCHKNTPVIALYSYEDEEYYYECEDLHEDLLKKIREKYPQYKFTTREADKFHYIANNCIHCERIQDDWHLFNKENAVFKLKENIEPKYFIAYNENTEELEYISEFYN